MKLKRVDIFNYRSIKTASISFDKSFRVIVGLNESGKSNLLSAMSLLDPSKEPTPDDERVPLADEEPSPTSRVRFIFEPSNEERERVKAALRNKLAVGHHRHDDFFIEDGQTKTLEQVVDGLVYLYIVHIPSNKRVFAAPYVEDRLLTFKSYAPVKSTIGNGTFQTLDGTERELADIAIIDEDLINVDSAKFKEVGCREIHAVLSGAVKDVAEPGLPTCISWSFDPEHLLPGRIDLDSFKTEPEQCLPLLRMFAIAGVHDVTAAFASAEAKQNGVRNLLDRVGKRATQHVQDVWREAKGVEFVLSQNGPSIECVVKDRDNSFDLSRRSDGFKRFVTMMIMVTSQATSGSVENNLILMDEPDLGLHPSGIRCLASELQRVAKSNQLVVATHSIFLVDPDDIARHLIVRRKDEVTSIDEVGPSKVFDEEVIYNAMGYSAFQQISRRIIIFEGWRDKQLFRAAISRVPKKHHPVKSVLVPCGNCHATGAKDVRHVASLMELARREIIILSDADDPSVEQQRKYDGDGRWYTYADIDSKYANTTAEDFLKPAYLMTIVSQVTDDMAGPARTPLTFSEASPVLEQVKSWLRQRVTDSDQIRQILERIKDRAFTSLDNGDVKPEYFEMLSGLVGRISAQAETARSER